MEENVESGRIEWTKWLRLLFYARLAGAVNTLISDLTYYDGTWVGRAITLFSLICLLRMAPGNGRYRGAAVCRAASFVCGLIGPLVLTPIVLRQGGSEGISLLSQGLALAVMVTSLVATYQEFRAHGELAAEMAGFFKGLFIYGLLVTVLGSVAGYAAAQLFELSKISGDWVNLVGKIVLTLSRVTTLLSLWGLYRITRRFCG